MYIYHSHMATWSTRQHFRGVFPRISSVSARKGNRVQWGLMATKEIRPFEELVIKKSLEYGIHPRIEIGAVEQAKRYVDVGVRHFCIGWDRFMIRQQLAQLGSGMKKLVENL